MAQMALDFEAPEQRRIPGFGGGKGVAFYTVDARGVVRSHWRSGTVKELRPSADSGGRLIVSLYNATGQHTVMVHRIVALLWLGPCSDGMEVSHLNGDCKDNRPENLKYESHADNLGRRDDHGTMVRGEAHWNATLTAEQALEIYALAWAGDLTQREIGERFGILQVTVSCIKHGRNWAEITGHTKILRKPRTRAQLDRGNELERASRRAKTAARRQAKFAEAMLSC